jgi:predicted DCC family thiol-disulfide oxidoreductase YuxK
MPIVKVWYDSSCPLCAREIALMRRLDKRSAVRFVDIRAGVDCPLDRSELLARFHAQEGDGPVVSGAAAFAAMWRAIPPLRPLGLLARNRIVLWGLEKAYLGFLVIRPTLQRLLFGREALPESRQ